MNNNENSVTAKNVLPIWGGKVGLHYNKGMHNRVQVWEETQSRIRLNSLGSHKSSYQLSVGIFPYCRLSYEQGVRAGLTKFTTLRKDR